MTLIQSPSLSEPIFSSVKRGLERPLPAALLGVDGWLASRAQSSAWYAEGSPDLRLHCPRGPRCAKEKTSFVALVLDPRDCSVAAGGLGALYPARGETAC